MTLAQRSLGRDELRVSALGEDSAPIPGAKRRAYLKENVGALDVTLTREDLARIDEAAGGRGEQRCAGERRHALIDERRRRNRMRADAPYRGKDEKNEEARPQAASPRARRSADPLRSRHSRARAHLR